MPRGSWSVLLLSMALDLVTGTGKGPIGLFAVDDRFAVVADSEFNGLFVVDVLLGGVVGSRLWPGDGSAPKSWNSMTGLASCPTCDFIFVTTSHGAKFWRLHLDRPLAEMGQKRDFLSLHRAPIVECGDDGIQSTRMVAISEDGKHGFLATFYDGVFHFDPRDRARPQLTNVLDKTIAKKASGVSVSQDGKTLYVTLYSSVLVASVTAQPQSEKSGVRNLKIGKLCHKSSLHIRETAEVNGVLYVVGHPGGRNPGMVVFAVQPKRQSCSEVAGNSKKPTGWLDGVGDQVRFSRPHQIIRFGTDVLLSDIDNRALRRIDLSSEDKFHVSTVPYDEGNLWGRLWQGATATKQPLIEDLDVFGSVNASTGAKEAKFCAQQGLKLCSLSSLRLEASSQKTRLPEAMSVFTSQPCNSCWLHYPGQCPPPSPSDKASSRDNAAWGYGTQMVAHFETKGHHAKGPRLRFECQKDNSPTHHVFRACCR